MRSETAEAVAPSPAEPAFILLLRRYFFFSWLFQDLSATPDPLSYQRAQRHNRAMRRYLPGYFVRWLLLGVLWTGMGRWAEKVWHAPLASALCFIAVALIAVVLAVILVAWIRLGLK